MSTTTTRTQLQEQYPCPLLEERFSKLKQSLIDPADRARVIQSYQRLKASLQQETDRIARQGPSAIPEVEFSVVQSTGGLPPSLQDVVRQTGCLIIRGVVPEEQATRWETELREYAKKHPKIQGYPSHDPQNFSLFWTPAQTQIRSHPQVLQAMEAVSKLWHLSSDETLFDTTTQVIYADRFRIRHPSKEAEYTLNAHQDSGAIERWEDPEYNACYRSIFEGKWEEYDPWNADHRSDARTDLYKNAEPNSVFRPLQGWLGLSHTGTGEGTLRLVPELKLSTAYQLLRPYFILEEEFNDTIPLFPGATPGNCQFKPTDKLHPHLDLNRSMVGIPPVKPGDYVFWHCDLVHEVDKLHPGTSDSSVVYNGCVPLCPYNLENLLNMRESFSKAVPPQDFINYVHGEWEREHPDHGAKRENILSDAGLRALGFLPFDVNEAGLTAGQKRMREVANEKLGFASGTESEA